MFGEMHVELPGVTESVCPHVSNELSHPMQLRAMKPCANRRSALRFPLVGQGVAWNSQLHGQAGERSMNT